MTVPKRNTSKFAPNRSYRLLIAKIHVAQKDMGLCDDDYRAILLRVAGVGSAADMTEPQMQAVLAEFKRLGWQAKPRSGRTSSADHPSARKARALWISLHQLGVIRNPAESALEAFAARQLKVQKLQWINQSHCYKLVEALKAMAERNGWSQDTHSLKGDVAIKMLRSRLLHCQFRRLQTLGIVPIDWHLSRAVHALIGEDVVGDLPNYWISGQIDIVIKKFGEIINERASSAGIREDV